jgi:gamma-glutamyltranspeptidase/glutathione hydrolase
MRSPKTFSSALALLGLCVAAACGAPELIRPAAPPPGPPPVTVTQPAPPPVADAGAAAAADGGARGEWPYSTPVTVRSTKGMVVSDNAIASNVGRDVLAAGGNAADAAVATAFALAVAYPTAASRSRASAVR